MVAHVYRYLLAEDVRRVVITLTPAVSHNVVSILQVPLDGPCSWYCRRAGGVSIASFFKPSNLCFDESGTYSLPLRIWRY